RRLESRRWEVATSKERCRFGIGRIGNLVAALFSDDGKILYTAGEDHVVRRWDTDTGEELQTEAGQGAVTAVAIAPDGKTAVTAGRDAIVHAWDLLKGQRLRHYQGHRQGIRYVTYSPDGRMLASAAGRFQGGVRLWDVSTG